MSFLNKFKLLKYTIPPDFSHSELEEDTKDKNAYALYHNVESFVTYVDKCIPEALFKKNKGMEEFFTAVLFEYWYMKFFLASKDLEVECFDFADEVRLHVQANFAEFQQKFLEGLKDESSKK